MRQKTTPPPLNQILTGEILSWKDEKGFGFIRLDDGYANLFFHISSYPYHHRRPQVGQRIYCIAHEYKGRYSAKRVVDADDCSYIEGDDIVDKDNLPPHIAEASIFTLLSTFFYLSLGYLSPPLALASFVISLLTFTLYKLDKRAALKNKQRIPEASLHIATLLGGWPGALIARALMRHKTKKLRFVIFFWLSIVIYFFSLYSVILWLPQHLESLNQFFELYLSTLT